MIYDDTDIMWCHDKLINWLPESDIIELTDKFQLVNNFIVYETSQLSIRSLIPFETFLSHNVILHSSSRRTMKFIFNQTLISRDFSIVFRLPELSISHTENSLSTKACESGAANRSTAKTESWLSVCFWTTIKPEFQRLVFHHHTGWNISKVFVDYRYRCGWHGCISWLVVSAFKNRDLRSFVIRFDFESYVRFEIRFVLMVRFEILESSALSIVIRKQTIGGG